MIMVMVVVMIVVVVMLMIVIMICIDDTSFCLHLARNLLSFLINQESGKLYV